MSPSTESTGDHSGSAKGTAADRGATVVADPDAVEPAPEAADSQSAQGDELPPVVIDLGRTKRKWAKRLKRGEGPLIEEIESVIEQVREELHDELGGRELLPVVVLYERKPKRKGLFE
ncbi:MAG: hypothetical protein DWQ36_02270 [Acidobacteria bacterium]|mgnify:CR=1 FL=1|nr:MAG: hypothetical protein DWQ30_23660 [Acidobacteriota bacterium]REK11269.1 MAG: hypothetical protein DWQ36_02270 [Acidobacteriota bacterium]